MAKFIYRMQNILNLKLKLEEQQKMEFAAARKRLDEEEDKLHLLFRRKEGYEEEGRRLREDNLNVQDILDNRNALLQMDDYIAFQRIQVSKAEAKLEELLERAGRSKTGSITGLYTVLVDGDDFNEPITDTARSILDGHVMLSRKLAHRNHYPAIDILQSISRCMSQIAEREHKQAAGKLKNVLATYSEAEDLINIGAYKNGSNPNIDYAIEKIDAVNAFLMQAVEDKFSFEEAVSMMKELFND